MILDRLFKRRRDQRVRVHNMYVILVNQARDPVFYRDYGVPDTLDGRFDMIVMHVFLVIWRLRLEVGLDAASKEESDEFQVKLQEILFADMDQALRELGVGDMGVGKRVKDMAQAFFGRSKAYGEALGLVKGEKTTPSPTALNEAIRRNLFRGVVPNEEHVNAIAGYVRCQADYLRELSLRGILDGQMNFAPIPSLDSWGPAPGSGSAGHG